jgi:hypothetical protein
MIAMFLAAAFGMSALLSVQASLPPLDRLFGPSVVGVQAGPPPGGGLPLPAWGRSPATAAEPVPAEPVARIVERPGGPVPPPGSPDGNGRHRFLRGLAERIVESAPPRVKILVRTGRVEGRHVLIRTAARILRQRHAAIQALESSPSPP